MAWVPGGYFWMGSTDPAFPDTRPVHLVYVDGFWMDRTDVTNAEYARFVKATDYLTIAERTPNPKDYPGAPVGSLFAGSFVFMPPSHPEPLDNIYRWWKYVRGADWRHPDGPASDITNKASYPVVQIAWTDAQAYCKWAGERLPTEAEFEFAARGGLDRKRYPWGNQFRPNGKFMANTFQGHFPDHNSDADGYREAAPVASFPPNGYGLYDMAGNVWEWTADWYRPNYYQTLAAKGGVARNPQGPSDSFNPEEPGVPTRVQRGGSFLCTDQYCSRYVVGSRGKGAADTGADHIGFRCVKDR